MPQIFSIGGYVVYFWSDEGEPSEPVHVHVTQGRPQKNGTKCWISGKEQIFNQLVLAMRRARSGHWTE